MEIRHATAPDEVRGMDTAALRGRFLAEDLLGEAAVRLVYSHHDRLVIGGVRPGGETVPLPDPAQLRSEFFLQRRELGVVNVGAGAGRVVVDGTGYDVAP